MSSARDPEPELAGTVAEEGTSEALAQLLAARARAALSAQLQTLYADAAREHRDLVTLAPERVEALARAAGERADGTQWRCALATVAAEELQLSFGAAVRHPAVVEAHRLLGAPPYGPPALDADEGLTLDAVHVAGVADLAVGQDEITICLSADGFDIIDEDGAILGRLPWEEIDALEVPDGRPLRGRRRRQAHLQVRAGPGDATFEVPSLTVEELREQVARLVERFGRFQTP